MPQDKRLHVYLPQTIFRMVGIGASAKCAFRYDYLIRNARDEELQQHIYQLNSLLLSEMGIKIEEKVSTSDSMTIENEDEIVDMQVLNLSKHFKGLDISHGIDVVDYASSGHRDLRLTDLKFTKEFVRATKRNLELWKRFRPLVIYTLLGKRIQRRHGMRATPWQSQYIDLQELEMFARRFMKQHSAKFQIQESYRNKILVLPHASQDLGQVVKEILELDPAVSMNDLVVKPHRNAEKIESSLREVLNDRGVQILDLPQQQILPSELVYLGLDFQNLYTTVSSSFYTLNDANPVSLKFTTPHDTRDFGLLSCRLNKEKDHTSQD